MDHPGRNQTSGHGATRQGALDPAAPPLSRDLRDFPPQRGGYPLRWADAQPAPATFQSVITQRSFGLSVSGAVAPSAPEADAVRTLPLGVFD